MATPMLMYGRKHQRGLNWITAIAMTGFHIGAVAALFYVDYGAMLAALILYYAGGMLGIGMSYHRLLTHRSYKTPKFIEYFLTICGTLALEGGPIFWVATHRIHHQKSDQDGDPHTPREGTFWAHMGWILMGEGLHHDASVLARYVLLMGLLVWFLSFFLFPKATGWEMSQMAIDRIPIFGFAIGAALGLGMVLNESARNFVWLVFGAIPIDDLFDVEPDFMRVRPQKPADENAVRDPVELARFERAQRGDVDLRGAGERVQ